eukprot:COSAG01_NODE_2962_length_6786_cov_21.580544_8_plen_117_part_00
MGFSFCNESRHQRGADSCDHTDASAAEDNFQLLVKFFADGAFGEYRRNPLYLSGVSYAGVYVTTLASLVLNDPAKRLKLAGITLGNPTFRCSVLDIQPAPPPPRRQKQPFCRVVST